MNSDSELNKIQKEIGKLKLTKERKLKLSTSYAEREKLLKEIKDLDNIKKSPSAIKSFVKTFGKGFQRTGLALWGATKKGSKNLQKNSPEFREMNRTMPRTQSLSKPYSPLALNYFPTEIPRMSSPRVVRANKFKRKKVIGKQIKVKKGMSNPLTWEVP